MDKKETKPNFVTQVENIDVTPYLKVKKKLAVDDEMEELMDAMSNLGKSEEPKSSKKKAGGERKKISNSGNEKCVRVAEEIYKALLYCRIETGTTLKALVEQLILEGAKRLPEESRKAFFDHYEG